MGTIAVFDSGLGSLSIITEIQKAIKTRIIYFADQKNYPYGKKSPKELRKIIRLTINSLQEKFLPDVIVVGSNTPTLLFPDMFSNNKSILGVLPPLKTAQKKTKTKSIAILATTATIKNKKTDLYIKNNISKNISVTKIDATKLIDLVESAKFIYDECYCEKIIKETLSEFEEKNIDVATLSSTHIPFLLPILEKVFPKIIFLDPAKEIANKLKKNQSVQSKHNSLRVFSSGNTKLLEKTLKKLKIRNKVYSLQF